MDGTKCSMFRGGNKRINLQVKHILKLFLLGLRLINREMHIRKVEKVKISFENL